MSLVGSLQEFPLPDLFQMLAASEASGKVSLSRHDRQGLVVLRGGRIIYAASTTVRETLGSILVANRLLDEGDLLRALAAQHEASREARLGSVLVEMGMVSATELREAVRRQIQRVVAELLRWETGYFRFERVEVPDRGEIEVDLADFVIEPGLRTELLVLDAMNDGEDDGRAETAEASLVTLMGEISPPMLTGEVAADVLTASRAAVVRGFLFTVDGERLVLRAHHGWHDSLELELELAASPLLLRVAESLRPFCGVATAGDLGPPLFAAIGDPAPPVILIPLLVEQRVAALLFGDGARAPERVEELELRMREAGLSMEAALLERRRIRLLARRTVADRER